MDWQRKIVDSRKAEARSSQFGGETENPRTAPETQFGDRSLEVVVGSDDTEGRKLWG